MVATGRTRDCGCMTATLHIENTVNDYASWKRAFDRYDRFRLDGGVRRHRISRGVDDPNAVVIDLDFDTVDEAAAFHQSLQKVWASPQSRAELTGHAVAIYETVNEVGDLGQAAETS